MFKITNSDLVDIMRINEIKQKLNHHLLKIILFLSIIIIVQTIAIIFLFFAKEQVPYLVFYSKSDQNFVKVEKANSNITNQEAVKYLLISSYIDKRESINRINDLQKLEDVKNQSNTDTWNILIKNIQNKESIYNNINLTREVKIINISYITENIASVYFTLTQKINNEVNFKKQYRVTLEYEFKEQKIPYGDIPKNPLGFFVTKYGITEITPIPEEEK